MTPSAPSRDGSSTVLTTGELAGLVEGELHGSGEVEIRDVAPIEQAEPDELGLLAMRRYLRHLRASRAGALLVASELAQDVADADAEPGAWIEVEDPHRVLPVLLERFHPPEEPDSGVHDTAVLGRGVRLGDEVRVGPYAVLDAGVRVGDGTRIGAHVTVGAGSSIGERCVLHPQVVLYPGSLLGDRVILHAGVKVGVDGFGYVTVDGEHRKVPQVGACVVEDDVEIGANCTLDRGSIGRTVVGRGTKLDNLVHLAHNVEVGSGSLLVAQVGVAGSTRLGPGVVCGGQAGIVGHLEIGSGARIGAQAGVIGDVEAGETVSGFPARDHRRYLKGMAMVMRLPDVERRLRAVEALAEALEEKVEAG